MLDVLKTTGYPLPPKEIPEGLTAKDITDKIREFINDANPEYEHLIPDFYQLIADYPVSMCERRMSDTLKLLITLFYLYRPPKITIDDKDKNELYQLVRQKIMEEHLYSYEELGILFMRSKASIHDAIKEKETEVLNIIQQVDERIQARKIAFQEMVQEEKLKLLNK